ncbi:hypothetical protein [Avibacterium avium]|uniref:RiboL-PSP-HEPN domain-containing protein n=1 Tax=Avibacterium avium TaxID=751 RepID=A0A379ATI4_AVIAV|nr:hypothetical protein [Avibacterium avium]SUB24874.1 Uncharacterised protein [Avibacterium avium]
MHQHKKFILTPVGNILNEGVAAIKCLGDGIESYPISHYIMQSIFLRMSGAQEQKMKCIMWELAHNDFEFRFDFLDKHSKKYFSKYEEKLFVYKTLISQIKAVEKNFSPYIYLSKLKVLEETKITIERIFSQSNIKIWFQKDYTSYDVIWNEFKYKIETKTKKGLKEIKMMFDEDSMFCCNNIEKNKDEKNKNENLKLIYEEHVYKNRNRIAHNTTSYQDNLPTLSRLESSDYKYENYFLWLSMLILIDNIFIELYKKYLEVIEKKKIL